MTDALREAAQAALKALDALGDAPDAYVAPGMWRAAKAEAACTALRAALSAPPAAPQVPAGMAPLHGPHWIGAGPDGKVACRACGNPPMNQRAAQPVPATGAQPDQSKPQR